MAGIVFQTGFDHYTNVAQRFNSITNPGNLTITSGGRNGTNALRIAVPGAGSAATVEARRTLPAAISTIYGCHSRHISAFGDQTLILLRLLDVVSTQIDLRLLLDGTLQVTRAGTVLGTTSGLSALLTGVHYHIELKAVIHDSAGAIQVWINEASVLNLSGIDTQATANSTVSVVGIAASPASGTAGGPVHLIDDLVVRDDAQNGDLQVKWNPPTGIGTTDQWTASGAATTREAVDETPPNSDTDYMHTSTPGDISLFTHGGIPTTAEVRAVVPIPFAKKTDAGTATIKSVLRISGTNYFGASKAPSDSSYEFQPDVNMVSPDTGVAFTATEVNAMEFGVERDT
jgi:hypothetical protein